MRCTPKPIPPSGPAQQGGHYVITPLGNQKTLRRTLKKLPFKDVPSTSWGDVSHGRRVRRTVKAAWAPTWVDFPGAAQVVHVRRTRTTKDRRSAGKNGGGSAKRTTAEVVYPGLLPTHGTGLTPAGCRLGPGTLEDREPAPLRSVTWSSTSHHQLRTANGPEIMAALRNLATWPHPTLSRPQCLYRLNHQIPVTTTKTAIKLLVQPTT